MATAQTSEVAVAGHVGVQINVQRLPAAGCRRAAKLIAMAGAP